MVGSHSFYVGASNGGSPPPRRTAAAMAERNNAETAAARRKQRLNAVTYLAVLLASFLTAGALFYFYIGQ